MGAKLAASQFPASHGQKQHQRDLSSPPERVRLVPRPTFAGFECRRRAAVDLELEEDGREMIPDGLVGDAQMARDRTIRRTLRQIEDVARRTLKTAAQPTVKAINPRSRNIEARQPCPGWFRGRGGRHAGFVA